MAREDEAIQILPFGYWDSKHVVCLQKPFLDLPKFYNTVIESRAGIVFVMPPRPFKMKGDVVPVSRSGTEVIQQPKALNSMIQVSHHFLDVLEDVTCRRPIPFALDLQHESGAKIRLGFPAQVFAE